MASPSLTGSIALGGFRVGFAVGTWKFLDKCFLRKFFYGGKNFFLER